MIGKGKPWRSKPNRRPSRIDGFLDWLIDYLEKDERDYLSWKPIEDAYLPYLLAEYRAAAVRVARFPNQDNAREAMALIEAEIQRRHEAELARCKTERLERNAAYEELEQRAELRAQKVRRWRGNGLMRWDSILQAWDGRSCCPRQFRSPRFPRR